MNIPSLTLVAIALSTTALTGCLDGTTEPADPAVGPAAISELSPEVRGRHCAVEAAVRTTPDGPLTTPGPTRCFDTLAESVAVASSGALRLAPDTTLDQLAQMDVNAGAWATYLISIEYVAPRWDSYWGSYVVYSATSCSDTWSIHVWDLREQGMNDKISSSHNFGCTHGYHYENASFSGALIDCYNASINGHDPCYYNLGLLDDRSSSLTFTNYF
jgi:hypothetical protein